MDSFSAISDARLYSNDAATAATRGSESARYVAVTPPKEQPAPVIFVISALPPGSRKVCSPSVTRSTAPDTATAPLPDGECFARWRAMRWAASTAASTSSTASTPAGRVPGMEELDSARPHIASSAMISLALPRTMVGGTSRKDSRIAVRVLPMPAATGSSTQVLPFSCSFCAISGSASLKNGSSVPTLM